MYAGLTLRNASGNVAGTHQKIDRVASKRLRHFLPKTIIFPNIKSILHFEGKNGPDGLKLKSAGIDEPWHFIDPTRPDDRALIGLINDHIYNLTNALETDNQVRAAFEAAWLAHSITDGLTPAHHYPIDDKIEEIWGVQREDIHRSKTGRKVIKGNSKRDALVKNWEYYGVGGVITSHLLFEFGVASAVASEKFVTAGPTDSEVMAVKCDGFEAVFYSSLKKIAVMNLYEEYCRGDWTVILAKKIRDDLIPEIIKCVTLAWYVAAWSANSRKLGKK